MYVAPSNFTCPLDGLAITTKHMIVLLSFCVPDIKSETLFGAIKELLIGCDLPLELCRG